MRGTPAAAVESSGAQAGVLPAVRGALIPIGRGCLVLAVLTAVGYGMRLNSTAAACIYMIAVVMNCLDCGPLAAAMVSVMAVGCLDFFFTEPTLSFNVNDPLDAFALAAFLTSSLVVSRLAGEARQEAKAARRDRRHLERLYELAQRLIALDPLRLDQAKLLDAIRGVYDLKAAALFDGATAEIYVAGDSSDDLRDRTRRAYIMGLDFDEPEWNAAFRQLRAAAKVLGGIGLVGLEDARLVAGPVAALSAAGLERAQSVRAASRAAAEAHSEALRAAILDALAHEFKTPLATILTASGGIGEAGPLEPKQAELVSIVEAEAERMSHLSSRILRLARLDREELNPRLEPASIVETVSAVVERYARQSPDRQILFRKSSAPEEICLDRELYSLALSQLLDNACRYSPPRSTVDVGLEAGNGFITVTVRNSGAAIPPAERDRVFERFYRGEAARQTISGTGLGLYVARKIARAHGGSLDLSTGQSVDAGVTFRLSIPLAKKQVSNAAATSQNPDR